MKLVTCACHGRSAELVFAPLQLQLQAGVPDGERSAEAGKKEMYLSDADFQTHFGMDKAEGGLRQDWKGEQGVKSKLRIFYIKGGWGGRPTGTTPTLIPHPPSSPPPN